MNSRVLGGLCAIAAFGVDQGTKALALTSPALENGVEAAHVLDGRIPHVLLLELFTADGTGTKIDA